LVDLGTEVGYAQINRPTCAVYENTSVFGFMRLAGWLTEFYNYIDKDPLESSQFKVLTRGAFNNRVF
jgi:hypothetical protein